MKYLSVDLGKYFSYVKTILLIMQLSIFLLLISVFSSAASAYSQAARLTLKMENARIHEVFDAIEKQSEFYFFYNRNIFDDGRKVSIEMENKLIDEVLDELFRGENISYEISDRNILIKVDKSASPAEQNQQQQNSVSGRVTDSQNIPLPGVTVVVKGTTRGTVTNSNGEYTLSDVPRDATLIFSFVGMLVQEINVDNQTSINVTMMEDVIGIEEVVAIGYGTQRKADMTGAISIVKSEDIANRATANAAQSLQGMVAGVNVTNSGAPGSNPVIRIRGLGSVRSDTEPLYVVDDVLTNDISFLGNNDIETITVLKDASASAIYGVRAANGVIIITTKRGNKDRMLVNYSGYAGFQVPVDIMEMANAQEYIQLLNEKGEIAAAKTGGSFTPYDPSRYTHSTDWFNEILRNRAFITSHDVGFSGGNERTLFSTGASYFEQEGLMLHDLYKRINVRASVDSRVKDYLKVGFSLNLSNRNSDNSPNVAHAAFIAPPAVRVRDEATGNLMAMTEFGDYANPMIGLIYNDDITNDIRLVGSGFAELYLLKDFTFKSSYGVDGRYSRNRLYLPHYELVGGSPADVTERLTRRFAYDMNWYWDNTLTYNAEVGAGNNLTAMVGVSAQEQRGLWLSATRLDVPYYGRDNTLYLNLGSPDNQANNDGGSRIASFSYFGRVNYSHQEKYLITATVRRDGSSIFPENNRYDIFPSVGVGWVLSKEDFMADQTAFDFLKVRASWGEMGNNKIPELTAVSTVDYGAWNSTEFGGTIQQGASATYIGPENLLWEVTREFDVAVEGYMLNSRLSFEVDFYNKETLGAIFPVTVNSALGASNFSYLDNNADILNRGVELSLGWRNNVGDFSYRLNGNVAFNHNEVLSLRPGTIGIYGGYMNVNASTYTVVGHPIGEFYGRQVLGIFQNENEINSYTNAEGLPIQPDARPGDFKYEDINTDGVINDKDRTFLGSALPTYTFALNYFMKYKGIDFTLDLYGQGGNHIYNAKRFRQIGNENYDRDFYLNRWHGEGTSSTYPSADMASQDNKVVNSWTIEKGDFFRIQNIQLGYTLPATLTSGIGIESVRIYANAANPKTFFKYKGFTPEIAKTGPESATSQGVDSYVYPMSATYNFGVNINF
jgi:TonB-linked SusC/RagA family outer membrane protein